MSGDLTPEALMAKAVCACASARALLNLDDVDGACNRAYYAMLVPSKWSSRLRFSR